MDTFEKIATAWGVVLLIAVVWFLLGPVLRFLVTEGFNLSLTGFSIEELDGLLTSAADERDPDDAPALPEEPVSKAWSGRKAEREQQS